jgi:hypothetical protein
MKWLPWRSLVRRLALGHGFLDPFVLMARMQRFAQPSEVAEPMELLRAGATMHARGLINSRVIQNNLDWVWPFWVSRQVDPHDPAFLPRAFSITQINLTHRNWTSVGLPGCSEIPVIDPRGLVTPFLDGWSLDGWLLADDGRQLFPSRLTEVRQRLCFDPLSVATECGAAGLEIKSRVEVVVDDGQPVCRVTYRARSNSSGWMVIALRPFNTEGVSFIDRIELTGNRSTWVVDRRDSTIELTVPPDHHHVSQYRHGDVSSRMAQVESPDELLIECEAGMATAAAGYRLAAGQELQLGVNVHLRASTPGPENYDWEEALKPAATLTIPDPRLSFLYAAALRTLVVLSPRDVYPGPATYRRFWFRDAAFMINALLCAGLKERARRALESFPQRQNIAGYFLSQNGEWDSNGQALWIMHRYGEMTGESPAPEWRSAVLHGARWIGRKRVAKDQSVAHAGLLPAGFSAEHLGPNDYYYWDDFWSVAGLRAASRLAQFYEEIDAAAEFEREADELMFAIEKSLEAARGSRKRPAMPASPYRRLDAGAIGSIVAGYPLQVLSPDDSRLVDTADYLMQHCRVSGGFFQNIIHSGINPYLTLHIAQILLRAGDPRHAQLVDVVADLASPTGQWPEAVHPLTFGGCMGDGQHGWAAAEWLMMMRNSFIREEADSLVLGAGIRPEWLAGGQPLAFGKAPTDFGDVEVRCRSGAHGVELEWSADWRAPPAAIHVTVPGFSPLVVGTDVMSVTLQPLAEQQQIYSDRSEPQ